MKWLITSLIAIRSAQCIVACNYEGYDTGFYRAQKCCCVDEFEFEDLVSKKKNKARAKIEDPPSEI